MSETPYFDAYMRGERSSSHKFKSLGPGGFDPALMRLIRHSMPDLVAYDLTGVQPMTAPTGQTFTLCYGNYSRDIPIGEYFSPRYMRNS